MPEKTCPGAEAETKESLKKRLVPHRLQAPPEELRAGFFPHPRFRTNMWTSLETLPNHSLLSWESVPVFMMGVPPKAYWGDLCNHL